MRGEQSRHANKGNLYMLLQTVIYIVLFDIGSPVQTGTVLYLTIMCR